MLSQESPQSRRGKTPASANQKFVSKITIGKKQPWKRSTGAKTTLGKAIASQNGLKPSVRWHFRSDDPLFDAKIQSIHQGIDCLAQIQKCTRLDLPHGSFKVLLKHSVKSGRDGCEQWRAIAVRVTSEICTEYTHPRGDGTPIYVGDQRQILDDASAAAWQQIKKILEVLRSIPSSPIPKAIDVKVESIDSKMNL